MKTKINVGDIFYEEIKNGIGTHIVHKVGNKYFYTNKDSWSQNYKFNIDTLKYTNDNYHSRSIQLYRSEQEIKDKNEYSDLLLKIRKYFGGYSSVNLSLESLRTINDLINHKTTQ